jgi:hypothetical protein
MAAQINEKKQTVSIRKVEANRKNALKSTGPKTPRGKAYSGRNAIKHGLFARQFMDFLVHGEDPEEYNELLKGLRAQYQPVGMAEELEVERAALCWWRLKRAWRHENAMNRVALRDIGKRERAEQAEWCTERDKEEERMLQQLQSAAKQMEETGEFSEDYKQKIFSIDPKFESIWKMLEIGAQETLAKRPLSKSSEELSPQETSSLLAFFTVKSGISFLKQLGHWRSTSVQEIATAQHVIPNGDVLDKILRYETTIERQLGRSIDRLERLQRHRQGEMVPPQLRVHLTQ